MKKILIMLSLILLTTGLLSAKEPLKHHAFEIGYGGMFLGAGDLTGPMLDFEYTYRLNHYIGLSPRILFGTFNRLETSNSRYHSEYIRSYDLSVTLTPYLLLGDWLSANIGLSYRRKNGSHGNGYEQEDKNGDYTTYGNLRNYPIYKDEAAIGYTYVLDVKVVNREKIKIGTKASMHRYVGNSFRDIAWSVAAYVGFEL